VREGHFEGQRHIGQKAFPLVITPADGFGPSLDDALEWVKNSKPKIESALYDHLAILFRGFPARSPEEFDRFLGAFQYDDVNIRKSIFGSVRRLLEASPFEYIWLHHEDPLFPRPISKIFFMCEEPAKEGGQTTIAPSTVLVDKFKQVDPEMFHRCVSKQILSASIVSEATFLRFFEGSSIADAKAKAAAKGYSAEILDDGRIWLKAIRSPVFRHPITGTESWYNHMSWDWARFYSPKLPTSGTAYGDGTEARDDCIRVRDLAEEEKVAIPWKSGDVLMIDNFLCLHGRENYVPPRKNYAGFFH